MRDESPKTCPPMQDLGLSQDLMRAIRSLYETRRLQDARSDQRRGQLLRPVRALRATAGFAYFHEGEDWNAKIRSFDGIASMPLTSHKSQSRPSSAPRAGGPPGIPRTPRRSPSFEAGGQSQIPVSRKVQKSASRPWSARSAQTRATSATSLSSFSKEDATAPSAPRSDATGSGRERRCPECTADSACLNCASAPERPLLRGKRPSDALLLGRRRRFRPAKCRSQRPPVEPQVQRPTPEEEDALRQWKQAQIRDWLRRKDAEMLRRRRQQQAEEELLREKEEYQENRRYEHEAELQRQRTWRLHMAELRRQELQMEMDHQIFPGSSCSREAAAKARLGAKTLAAYSMPRIGQAGRTRRMSRCCSAGSRSARVSRGGW